MLSEVLIAATVIGVPSLHDHAVALTLQSSRTTDRFHRRWLSVSRLTFDFHIL
jgi:hypothetical protein